MTSDKKKATSNKKAPIIILHGWGLRGNLYKEIEDMLKKEDYSVHSLDLPGFGSEKLKKQTMTLDDYVQFVKDFMKKKKLTKVILLGHSFGGRVSIKLAAIFPQNVLGIILTGAPGIKQRLSMPRRIVQYTAIAMGELFRMEKLRPFLKILRKGLYFMLGEWDYYKSGDLRETFKKVIAEDLSVFLRTIKVPTLIVWGEDDRVVPLSVGKEMQRRIKGSKLIVIKDIGHKLPYENPKKFFDACLPFLKTL